jgi:hypothetical protein
MKGTNSMTETYYEHRDLEDFANIGEHAPEAGEIVVRSHCFACTAGAGSSCQGSLTE